MSEPRTSGSAVVGAAYDQSAEAWAAGPERVYRALARALADSVPDPAPDPRSRILDIGAGTGVLGIELMRRGATRVVAVDLSPRMLARGDPRVTAVVADAARLPFDASSFDLAVSAFCFSHLPDPAAGLREAARVAPILVAGSFVRGWTHPAKAVVDDVLSRWGFRHPSWYDAVKTTGESAVDDPRSLRRLAVACGFADARIRVREVDTGVGTPGDMAAWRLGMAQVAPFVRSLDARDRVRIRQAAQDALAGAPPLVIPLVTLVAERPRHG